MRALVVDDSRAMRNLVGRLMKELGFEVLEAVHGRDALDKVKSGVELSIVLCDWNMPEMDGVEFVRALRAESIYANLPVMMVTSEGDMSRVSIAIEAGANEYLMKPFDKSQVLEKLNILGLGIAT